MELDLLCNTIQLPENFSDAPNYSSSHTPKNAEYESSPG